MADDFWEAAKPSKVKEIDGQRPAWMTFDDHWVDEVKRGFKACSVFAWFPVYCMYSLFHMPHGSRAKRFTRAHLQPA